MDGSIDWYCYPHFDSPSVFAAILDSKKGGRFKIAPAAADARAKQLYWPDTNVLVTRFLSAYILGSMSLRLPASHLGMAKISCGPWYSTLSAA